MKRLHSLLPAVGVAALLVARAADPSGLGTTPAAVQLAAVEVPAPPPPPPGIDVDLERVAEEVRRVQETAAAEAEKAMRIVGRQFRGFRFGMAGPDVQRILVVPPSGADAGEVRSLREDLGVMSRILQKAADGEERGSQFRLAIGDRAWGRATDLDALYLDGHGAVFVVSVDQALVPPPDRGDVDGGSAPKADDTWERTRRELQGGGPSEDRLLEWEEGGSGRDKTPYDAGQVDGLRERLIGALRHAVNIRSMGPDSQVTVIVQGRGPVTRTREELRTGREEGRRSEEVWVRESGGMATLTLRVSLKAIADHAEGRMGPDAFAARVAVDVRSDEGGEPR